MASARDRFPIAQAARFFDSGDRRYYDWREVEALNSYILGLCRENDQLQDALKESEKGRARIIKDMLRFKAHCREAGML